MLMTTRRIAAAKPQVIEAYLKTMIEAIAVTVDPANKETGHPAAGIESALKRRRRGGILSGGDKFLRAGAAYQP